MMKIAIIKHFLVGISYKFQGFPWNFAFSMKFSSKIASLDQRELMLQRPQLFRRPLELHGSLAPAESVCVCVCVSRSEIPRIKYARNLGDILC